MFGHFKGLKMAGFDYISQFRIIIKEMIHIYNVVQGAIVNYDPSKLRRKVDQAAKIVTENLSKIIQLYPGQVYLIEASDSILKAAQLTLLETNNRRYDVISHSYES